MATNSKRIKEILSWYSSDSPGTLANLARLLGHGRLGGTGKLVILPVDQGFEHGPARSFAVNPPAYDPRYHFELAISAGCNAYAAPLGFLEAGAAEFAGDIPLILKLNNSDSLYGGSDPAPAVTGSVGDALRLGCSAIGFTIYPASALRNEMYEQIRELGEEAKSVGLAVVIWSYPRGSGVSKEGETGIDVVAYAAQIAAQLGVNLPIEMRVSFIHHGLLARVRARFDRLRVDRLRGEGKLDSFLLEAAVDLRRAARGRHEHLAPRAVGCGHDEMRRAATPTAVRDDRDVVGRGQRRDPPQLRQPAAPVHVGLPEVG